MKKIIITGLFLAIFAAQAIAQTNTFPTSGSAGIGTLSPQGLLDIYNTNDANISPLLSIRSNFHVAGYYGMIRFGDYTQTSNYQKGALIYEGVAGSARGKFHIALENTDSSNSVSLTDAKLTVLSDGNVGIGTITPQTKLHITQTTPDQAGLIIQGSTINTDGNQHYIGLTFDGDYGNGTGNYSQIRSYSNLYNYWGSSLGFFTTTNETANTLVERMRIAANGHIGIGTTTPTEKLSVNGKIRAKEIKVETANWPDYVFEEDYQSLSLAELEKFIKANKHLPEMPTAKEVTENGIALGEMNKLLLKKVEELTLLAIKKDKELNVEKEINKTQTQMIQDLTNRIDEIYKKLKN